MCDIWAGGGGTHSHFLFTGFRSDTNIPIQMIYSPCGDTRETFRTARLVPRKYLFLVSTVAQE